MDIQLHNYLYVDLCRIPYAVKISVLRSWRWAKDCPKHVALILEINKLLLLHLVGSSILLYRHCLSLTQFILASEFSGLDL